MAALTANKEVTAKFNNFIVPVKLAAGAKIFKGAMVKLNSSGYGVPMAAGASTTFAGIAIHFADNTSGAAGDVEVLVWRKGAYILATTGFTEADVNKVLYASTDQDCSYTQGANELKCGKSILPFISATEVWCEIDSAT